MKKVIITGAAGGMGRACARLFGATNPLILTDVAARPLEEFAETLRVDGYDIAGVHAGDLCDEAVLSGIAASLNEGEPFVLIHTAGLSPALADWRPIVRVNLVATERVLRRLEPLLVPGSVGILIASTAGYVMPVTPEAKAIMADPLAPDLLERIEPEIAAIAERAGPAGMGGIAYSLTKEAVLRMCEKRAGNWGSHGARIVSISPGLMLTPMGRKELTETAGAEETMKAAAVGRPGTAMDIALAAQFLASDNASFITGSDLKVDGGAIAVMGQLYNSAD